MAKACPKLELEVTLAWWLKLWLAALVFVAVMTRSQPDEEKLQRMIKRGLTIKVKR